MIHLMSNTIRVRETYNEHVKWFFAELPSSRNCDELSVRLQIFLFTCSSDYESVEDVASRFVESGVRCGAEVTYAGRNGAGKIQFGHTVLTQQQQFR